MSNTSHAAADAADLVRREGLAAEQNPDAVLQPGTKFTRPGRHPVMTDPPGPVIAAAVIINDGRLLLIKRRVPEAGLVWQLPAGKVEPGETVEQAAVREALEEVALTVSARRLLGERVHPDTGRHIAHVACGLKVGAPRQVAGAV